MTSIPACRSKLAYACLPSSVQSTLLAKWMRNAVYEVNCELWCWWQGLVRVLSLRRLRAWRFCWFYDGLQKMFTCELCVAWFVPCCEHIAAQGDFGFAGFTMLWEVCDSETLVQLLLIGISCCFVTCSWPACCSSSQRAENSSKVLLSDIGL